VLERARERPPVPLPPEEISIETRIEQLLDGCPKPKPAASRICSSRLRPAPT
jgi:hypothetical protein